MAVLVVVAPPLVPRIASTLAVGPGTLGGTRVQRSLRRRLAGTPLRCSRERDGDPPCRGKKWAPPRGVTRVGPGRRNCVGVTTNPALRTTAIRPRLLRSPSVAYSPPTPSLPPSRHVEATGAGREGRLATAVAVAPSLSAQWRRHPSAERAPGGRPPNPRYRPAVQLKTRQLFST